VNAIRLNLWQHLIVFVLVVAAIVSRRPDALLNPQFYGEDGATWFANAWNQGWLHSLTLPAGGYLNALPRLLCGIALLVPLKSVPLLLNGFGIVIQALPVNVLLTARCSNWGPLWLRGLQAALYVVLPNSSELDVTITNAHWHLALIACLISFAKNPGNAFWRIFDAVILLLTGLTGPWCLVLTPLILVFWWYRRQRWSLVMASLLATCAAVQVSELLAHVGRPLTPIGASIALLLRLIAGQIYMGALWGQNSFARHGSTIPAILIFCLGTTVLIYGVWKLHLEMKLFIAFAVLITTAALQSPLIAGPKPRWLLLADDPGARYWFFPMLALVWSLLWAASRERPRALRTFSLLCFALMSRAIWHDWHYRPYIDGNFADHLRQFEAAAPGTEVTMPIVPEGTQMTLIKKKS
jgi:hypothetical protein